MSQDENTIPLGKDANKNRKSSQFLPKYFRTIANEKFLSSTLDQLINPGVVEKVDGYFGRKNAKAYTNNDNYISDVSTLREDYQFEPVVVKKDNLNNVTYYSDYNDYINGVKIRNGNVENHSLLNTQEYYAWEPHINWDKFVNFREYYWMPNGPDSIAIIGELRDIETEFNVKPVDNVDNVAYGFKDENTVVNETLTLYRGQKYTFNIETPNMPFSIRYNTVLQDDTLYSVGLSTNTIEQGVIEFEVPENAPDRLYYTNDNDERIHGLIIIRDAEENTSINVDKEILGRVSYTMTNGYSLSNGMKVEFRGDVTPEKYATGAWYVEGVGKAIRLVSETNLEITGSYIGDEDLEFDTNPFDKLPFDDAKGYASVKDYIVVNRAAPDLNYWSRYNRWTHRSVIETTALVNDTPAEIDQNYRATRPIIEYSAGLKLFDFGTKAKQSVDLIDLTTKDVFSTVEGASGYNVDGIDLVQGMRVLFAADTDILVNGKIFEVKFINHSSNATTATQISLIEVDDTTPQTNETVLIKDGNTYQGKMFFYNGTEWKIAQEKTGFNQHPRFDLFGTDGNSLSTLESSTFTGTKLFSYREGTGTNDTELGFPLAYRSIENSGDIIFDFNILTDTFTFQNITDVLVATTDSALLRQYTDLDTFETVSPWIKAGYSKQKVVRQFRTDELRNNFPIDVYKNSGDLNDLVVEVYVNNNKLAEGTDYELVRINQIAHVTFPSELTTSDKIVIKTQSNTVKNDNGYYEFPVNLQNNPKNENVEEFTLGQVIDHVNSIVENVSKYSGTYPGVSNLRDLGEISKYGTRFVQHSGSLNLPALHFTKKEFDIVKAVRFAKGEYSKFKRMFLQTADSLGFDGPLKDHVDKVLLSLTSSKTETNPFYFSDMVPFGGFEKATYQVFDLDNNYFPTTTVFDLNGLSQRSIQLYLNGVQLVHGKDYVFNENSFVEIIGYSEVGDTVEIYEYETTDGCWIPPTPTKLGLWKKYQPKLIQDDTYQNGVAEDDTAYKIYGYLDPQVNATLERELGYFYPVYINEDAAIAADANGEVQAVMFEGSPTVLFMPANNATMAGQDIANLELYPEFVPMIQGHDGSLTRAYLDYRDSLLLEVEKRIYNNIKISYDTTIFDIDEFINTLDRPTGFDRYSIDPSMIVDFNDWLRFVGDVDYTENYTYDALNSFTWNYYSGSYPDGTPLPGYWRAIYKDYYGTDRPHTMPWECLGFAEKPSWWEDEYGAAPYTKDNFRIWEDIQNGYIRDPLNPRYNNNYKHTDLMNYIPVDSEGKLLSPDQSGLARRVLTTRQRDSFKFGDEAPVETAWRRSSDYAFAILTAWIVSQPAKVFGLAFDRSRITRNDAGELVYTETNKRLNLSDIVLPAITTGEGRVYTAGLVNYMQGMLADNTGSVYKEYKDMLATIDNQLGFKLAGFTSKEKFKLILDARTPLNEGNIFVPDENYQLVLNTSTPIDLVSYSGVIIEKQAFGFVVRGYDKTSPEFKVLNPILLDSDPVVRVGGVSERFLQWNENKRYAAGQVVEYNTSYYRVKQGHDSGSTFNPDFYQKLPEVPLTGGVQATFSRKFETTVKKVPYGSVFTDIQQVVNFLLGYGKYLESQGFVFDEFNKDLKTIENWNLSAREFLFWTLQNWKAGTVISLSPAANYLKFERDYVVVDDIFDNFFDYSLLSADGKKLIAEFGNTVRDKTNSFGLRVRNTTEGIYHVKIPVVQKEHAIVIDNRTVFGDIIYDRPSGYRQERIRALGYRSDDWNGGLNIPGFIYDSAEVTDWQPWQRYAIGELVKYKQFYYSANQVITGSENFNDTEWNRLNEKPESKLLPNFDYKANQFTDFYSLETNNFDTEQQRLAQHFIGYQKRKYLENIIPDSTSQYKFYQGFIRDKGTKNALTKLFDKLGSASKDSLEFYEEWAIRLGQYGSNRGFDEFEVIIPEEDYRLSPQPIVLVDEKDPNDTSLILNVKRNEVYLKPEGYNHKPFPTTYFTEGFLKTAGYVDRDDVQHAFDFYDDLLDADISTIVANDYVWVANKGLDWNVYKTVDTNVRIVNIEQVTEGLNLQVNINPNVVAGDIIGVRNSEGNNKFFKVISFVNDIITVDATGSNETDINATLVKLLTVRLSSVDEVNNKINEVGLENEDLLWIDNVENDRWAVLKNNRAYEITNTVSNSAGSDLFGSSISASDNNQYIVVGQPGNTGQSPLEFGSVNIYSRGNEVGTMGLMEEIRDPNYFTSRSGDTADLEEALTRSRLMDPDNEYGKAVAISPDGKYLIVGAPSASNVRSTYAGRWEDYVARWANDEAVSIPENGIVSYTGQLWKAGSSIDPSVTLSINTFDASVFVKEDQYTGTNYPEVEYIIRGNYAFAADSTDHVLIRAEESNYEATKPGDKLVLEWNEFTTRFPDGYLPFKGHDVLTKDFFTGEHTIVSKVDDILVVDSTQSIPDVDDTIKTTTGRAIVVYRYTTEDNRTIIYINNVNGYFEETADAYNANGNVLIGEYYRAFAEDAKYSKYAGYWLINTGTSFNSDSDQVVETNENLVVRYIATAEEETYELLPYYNIFNNVQNDTATNETPISYVETLSFIEGQTEAERLSPKWIVRLPQEETSLQAGDQFRMWFNTIRTSIGTAQDPAAIGLSWDYLNNRLHTIDEIWDGWLEVRYTNFDTAGSPETNPNYGNPYVPEIGNQVIDSGSGASATVAFVIALFDRARIFVRDATEGWPLGINNDEYGSVSFDETDSTIRLSGDLLDAKLNNDVAGKLLVVDKGEDIPVTINSTSILEGYEYYIYQNTSKEGQTRDVDAPSQVNLNWSQVYNIPVLASSDPSGELYEGAYAIYVKNDSEVWDLVGYYSVPNSETGLRLGSEIKIVQNNDTYTAYIHAAGDEQPGISYGKVYIIKNNGDDIWKLGQDTNYRGNFTPNIEYYEGDIVKFGGEVYRADTNLVASEFNSNFWTLLENRVDIEGFIPVTDLAGFDDSMLGTDSLTAFGRSYDVSHDGEVLIVTADYNLEPVQQFPQVLVYKKLDGRYVFTQTIESNKAYDESFAESISISSDGKQIAISAPSNNDIADGNGAVYIYTLQSGEFVRTQTLYGRDRGENTGFGKRVSFDQGLLSIISRGVGEAGSISLYESIGNTLIYADNYSYGINSLDAFKDQILTKDNHIYVAVPRANSVEGQGTLIDFRKGLTADSWLFHKQPIDPADLNKFKGVFLYDTKTQEFITYLDYIDPIQGKIAGPAEQEITFKTSYDPAIYSYKSTDTTFSVNYDTLNCTAEKFVGKIWWDIDSAKYVNPYQGDIITSANKFSQVFEGNNVEVYEWIKTTLTPAEWDAQADTETGLTKGISGQSKYGNDVYSTSREYDVASGTFTTYYYFWVADKKTVPNIETRNISAYEVKQYIADPATQGHKFVTILGSDRFVIYNCESLIKGADVAISFRYWTIENQEQNAHTEYQIISDGLSTSKPNSVVEQKWFDSLIGYDKQDRMVPDPNLAPKQRYGNLNLPRQSWFVNRFEALKQAFERINNVLIENLIVDNYDISNLTQSTPTPTTLSGKYDTAVDTELEIRFVSIANAEHPEFDLLVVDGKIQEVNVVNPGKGYTTVPTYEVVDSLGTGAELEITLNSNGGIASVDVINKGSNYSQNAYLSVRRFSALVRTDSSIDGRWSIYSWNGTEWIRAESQAYDVNLYWDYADWYETGYSETTAIDYLVNQSYELELIDDNLGDIVKIKNVGTGGWLLLKKVNSEDNVDYTINYDVIGREKGTIQFSSKIYDSIRANSGFDGTSYDKVFYDIQPIQELRIILETIRDELFINDLEEEYNKLFFSSVRYVFFEQPTVDWAFKTSFVKAKHNVGQLEQSTTFKNDSLSSYEDYVSEAKPYRTKIREYVSSYENLENSNTVVTDFDLPPYYSDTQGKIIPQDVKIIDGEIVAGSEIINQYPSKNWLDNVGFEVSEIVIGDAGSGYAERPVIKLVGGGGTGAEAIAYLGRGKITAIEVTKPGSGYITPPEVVIEGSLTEDGTTARASSKLGSGKVRSSHIRVKFDRTTGTYLISTLDATETFASQPNQTFFDLKWPMDLRNTSVNVVVNGTEALRSEYTFENVEDTTKGFTRYTGRVIFNTSPAANSEVVITYLKGAELLQAQDRINLFYNPTTGQLANDISQLLTGVDYGGVEVTSVDFGGGAGWDADRWFTTTWDTFDNTYEDEVFVLDGSTVTFNLAQPLATDVQYNIYKNGVRLDDPAYGTENQTNNNAVMLSITGDGEQQTLTIDEELIPTTAGDIIVIRKSTSDGSFIADPRSYDTLVDGGDLNYQTARGIAAEDITVDGDGFVTPTTSGGPEELVPGQVLDTVDIKVYHRTGGGASTISSNSYVADGTNTTFGFDILPQSNQSIIVKVDNQIVSSDAYTVDHGTKTVIFDTAPTATVSINIISLSSNGDQILDTDQFEGDGSTLQFVTRVAYQENINFFVTVDGEPVDTILETTDSSYDIANRVVLVFGEAPKIGAVINYALYASTEQTFSQIAVDNFTADGTTSSYEMSVAPFATIPTIHNLIVRVGDKILSSGYKERFIIDDRAQYQLRLWQVPPGTVGFTDILVLLNGKELNGATEYIVRPATSSLEFFEGVTQRGDLIEVYFITDAEYSVTDNVITLNEAPENGTLVQVYNFSKHDVQSIDRFTYDVVSRITLTIGTDDYEEYNRWRNGYIKLDKELIDAQYVWVAVNGELKTPSVDYKVTDDRMSIKLLDTPADGATVEIIQFATEGTVTPKFAFRQTKDILNSTVYKRLGSDYDYVLAQDLTHFDNEIILEDATGLPTPSPAENLPGVLLINSERIEFFRKEGNVLSQLRRGTNGTGAPAVHDAGSYAIDQGFQQTVPYKDETVTITFDSDGSTKEFDLGYIPASVNEFEVFVGGRRLRKTPIQVFDATIDQDSPEADITSPAEFSVDGTTSVLTLTDVPPAGASIVVARKIGRLWVPVGASLEDEDNSITRFLKSKKAALPE
jgi:hypothetical protein